MIPRRTSRIGSSDRSRHAAGALRVGVAVALVATAIGLAGCTPGPAPKPTPTPLFTSEADAFKAAEQVYRDYVDAGNARRTGASAEPESYLMGKALEDDISTQRLLKERGVHVTGDNVLTDFHGVAFNAKTGSVDADVCLDVSASHVISEGGADVTPADRNSLVSIRIRMVPSGVLLKITESTPGEGTCAAP